MRSVDKSMVPAVTVPRLTLYLRKLRELQARGVERSPRKELAEQDRPERGPDPQGLLLLRRVRRARRGLRGHRASSARSALPRPRPLLERDHRRRRPAGHGAGPLQGLLRAGLPAGRRCSTAPQEGRRELRRRSKVRDIAELEEFCRDEPVDIAIITVPAHAAQATIDRWSGSSRLRRAGHPQLRAGQGLRPARRHRAPGRPLQRAHVPLVLPRHGEG